MHFTSVKAVLVASLVGFALLHAPYSRATSFTTLEKISTDNLPASRVYKQSIQQTPSIAAAKLDIAALSKEDKSQENDALPYRFAVPLASGADFTKIGKWEVMGDTAIWRMKVTSKDAQSFNFGLKNVFLPKGTKLFFYNDDYSLILGPYTEKDNKSHGELWTPVIESKNVTIEINVPVIMQSYLKFEIAQINQGYRGIKSAQIAKSGSCNNDVACSEADAWRDEIRSVARYSISGTGLCSGTLMNNIEGDFKPYFLSAGHCGVSTSTDASLVLYWNYETTVCQATPNGQLNQFSNGSTFRAASSVSGVVGSDFVIVELDAVPDSAFNVYWAGWDNSSAAPSSAVGIHHPSGDEKRISFDNDPLTITNYGESAENPAFTHLRVGAWDDGTTEGGSSGSGIWNSAHHLVGTLSGGTASCLNPTDPDWYGRLSVHWTGDGSADGQVKVWLDPDNTGATTLDGSNMCTSPTVMITSSPATAQIGQQIVFSANASGGAGGTYTYAWDFNGDGVIDSTDSTPSYRYNYFHQGVVKVTAYDSTNCSDSDSVAIVVNNSDIEIFPVNAEVPADWRVPSSANAGWVLESSSAFEGSYSLKSESIAKNQSASIEVTRNFQNNESFVSFAYRVSSEAGYDKLKFYIDNVEQDAWSGNLAWRTRYYPLTPGNHTLRWSYEKDGTFSVGSDMAWIDGVIFSKSNEVPVASVVATTIDVAEGGNVSLDASPSSGANGDALAFSWEQTSGLTVALTNNNTSVATFTAPNVTSNTVLAFTVTVTDPSGRSDTANISVTVNDTSVDNNGSSGGGGGGSFGIMLLAMLFLLSRGRKRQIRIDG
ncbi:Lysyl endopeptidase [hydrothermal vent metagenome]|uniref:Lysyl endopeptidase n=1 Tax=hydrothermal vent metagenome TaxID=652676 RepID=A0A3B1B8I3_9ZZZZ